MKSQLKGGNNMNNKPNKNNGKRFYKMVKKQINALILHSVGSTILVLVTILLGIECATSGGYWAYILSIIICIAITIACIGTVIADTCNIFFIIKNLYDNRREY